MLVGTSIDTDEQNDDIEREKNTKITKHLQPIGNRTPIAIAPKIKYRPITFNAEYRYEGYVIDVYEYYFSARITDINDKEPDEDVEIFKKDVSEDDRKLIQPGSIFYWHIGYENDNGTIKRSSILKFRRLPRWSHGDLLKAKKLEKEYNEFLKDSR